MQGKNPDHQLGIELVSKALRKPLNTIAENAGVEAALVVEKVRVGLHCQRKSLFVCVCFVICLYF